MDDLSSNWRTVSSPASYVSSGHEVVGLTSIEDPVSNNYSMYLIARNGHTVLTGQAGGVVSSDLFGQWLPLSRAPPNSWVISTRDIPLCGGFISMFCPYDKHSQPLAPVYIVNPECSESNQALYLRTALPNGQLPYYWLYKDVPTIPGALKEAFKMDGTQIWTTYTCIPPVVTGTAFINFSVDRMLPSRVSQHSHLIPTFRYSGHAPPGCRIRQNSRLQLTCPSKNKDADVSDCTPPILVKGSRGFTPDGVYEILELDFEQLEHNHPMKYVWVYIPPPYVCEDVCMVVERFSQNAVKHEALMSGWLKILLEAEPGWSETPSGKDQRAWAVWSLMYWYLNSRRHQRVT